MCNSFDYSVAYNAKSWKHICKRLIKLWYTYIRSSQGALVVKHLPANAGDVRRRFDPWVRKIPWRRAWQPTPVFLPGEPHGQRSLVSYGPKGWAQLKWLSTHTSN